MIEAVVHHINMKEFIHQELLQSIGEIPLIVVIDDRFHRERGYAHERGRPPERERYPSRDRRPPR